MSIPDYQVLMKPVLSAIRDGEEYRPRDLVALMSQEFQLTADEAKQQLPSGGQTIIANRTHWAITYLVKSGLVARPKRGFCQITDLGLETLGRNPDRIDVSYLRQFPSFDDFVSPRQSDQETESDALAASSDTPDERIAAAKQELDETLADELLARILAASPAFFERLVVRLVVAMGYGGTNANLSEHTGGSGDGGIDGVVRLDRLGLDKVFIQAKRYAPENVIGRPAVQAFSGAMISHGVSKGVFFSTSRYSREAHDCANALTQQQISLVDGDELARLLIEHDVGVRRERLIELKTIDENLFDD